MVRLAFFACLFLKFNFFVDCSGTATATVVFSEGCSTQGSGTGYSQFTCAGSEVIVLTCSDSLCSTFLSSVTTLYNLIHIQQAATLKASITTFQIIVSMMLMLLPSNTLALIRSQL